MKKFFAMLAVLAVLSFAATAMAESNGQTVANNDIVRATSNVAASMVQSRVASIVAPKPLGLKASNSVDGKGNFNFAANANELGISSGDAGYDFGLWGMGQYTNFESTESGAKYDADMYNIMVGFDWRATPEFLIGVAAGWGSLDLDKKDWNGGADDGKLSTDDEWTIMPYLAYNITDTWILDGAFAYTSSEYKDDDGTNSSHYDTERYLTNIGISKYFLYDAWTFSGRLGYMYVHGDLSSYSRGGTDIDQTDSYLGQLSLEAKAAYFINGWEPYAALKYFYDTTVSDIPVDSDYDEFEGVLGVKWYASDQWSMSLEGAASMGRDEYESYRGQATVRYEF